MKVKEGFWLRKVGGAYVAVALGAAAKAFAGIVNLNESGAMLFGKLQTGADKPELVEALLKEYAVSEAEASRAVDEYARQLREAGILEP